MFQAKIAAAADRPGSSCASTPLTAVVRAREAALVAAATHRAMTAKRIDYLLQSGSWKMVWTLPRQDARNVFLFRQAKSTWRLIDTWHGELGTDDPQAGLDWAAARHVPGDLKDCFATVLVNRP